MLLVDQTEVKIRIRERDGIVVIVKIRSFVLTKKKKNLKKKKNAYVSDQKSVSPYAVCMNSMLVDQQ